VAKQDQPGKDDEATGSAAEDAASSADGERLTRAALRQTETTGSLDLIREVIATRQVPPATAEGARRGARRLRRAAGRWGGVVVAGCGIVGMGLVLALAAGQVIGQGEAPEPTSAVSGPVPTGSATPRPGTPGATQWSIDNEFVNGDYSMKLLSIEPGLTQLGDSGTWTSEQGQFVVISVEVKYAGSGSAYFPLDSQRLRVASGLEYADDVESSLRDQANELGRDALRPGLPQRGALVFDIPADTVPTALEFVGDFLAPPVTIPLG
jgi:hypothetical protein